MQGGARVLKCRRGNSGPIRCTPMLIGSPSTRSANCRRPVGLVSSSACRGVRASGNTMAANHLVRRTRQARLSTATNKVLKRELIARGVDPDGRVLWKRDGTSFRMLTERAVSGTDR
jgi:hypothetical protein